MRVGGQLLAVLLATTSASAWAGEKEDELLKAVRRGDAAAAKALLDGGVSANAKYRYDRSILSFAADRGNADIVELLLARGADVNAKDTFYGMTPLVAATQAGHVDVIRLLLARGATPADDVLGLALIKKNAKMTEVAVKSGKMSAEALSIALHVSEKAGDTATVELLRGAGAVPLPPADFKVDPAQLARYAAEYRDPKETSRTIAVKVDGGALTAQLWGYARPFAATQAHLFRHVDPDGLAWLEFKVEGDKVMGLTLKGSGMPDRWYEKVEVAP